MKTEIVYCECPCHLGEKVPATTTDDNQCDICDECVDMERIDANTVRCPRNGFTWAG